MRFTIYTLVDITETNTRRGEDNFKHKQHQNYLTVMQTIGLRVNPTYISPPTVSKETPSKVGLGKNYKNKQNIWKYTFDVEYESALDTETLTNDFNLIPIIDNLEETVKFDLPQFITKNPDKNNIIFRIEDK